MLTLYKIATIIVLLTIFFQDIKTRMVYWLLYAIFGVLGFLIMIEHQVFISAINSSMINLSIILLVISTIFIYARLIMRKEFLNTIGIGDLLLFFFLAFCFSNISFIILFVFSLLFSLILSILIKNKSDENTIPLAGYISLFFVFVYCLSFFDSFSYLFTL